MILYMYDSIQCTNSISHDFKEFYTLSNILVCCAHHFFWFKILQTLTIIEHTELIIIKRIKTFTISVEIAESIYGEYFLKVGQLYKIQN